MKASCFGAGAAGGVNVCFGFGCRAAFFAAGSLAGAAGGVNGAVVVVGATGGVVCVVDAVVVAASVEVDVGVEPGGFDEVVVVCC